MYECLASGKPVVSTRFPEAQKFADLIDTADDADEFERAINRALEADTPDNVRARQAAARRNSWDERLERIMGLIQERRTILRV